jgi:hypothetical protein
MQEFNCKNALNDLLSFLIDAPKRSLPTFPGIRHPRGLMRECRVEHDD